MADAALGICTPVLNLGLRLLARFMSKYMHLFMFRFKPYLADSVSMLCSLRVSCFGLGPNSSVSSAYRSSSN